MIFILGQTRGCVLLQVRDFKLDFIINVLGMNKVYLVVIVLIRSRVLQSYFMLLDSKKHNAIKPVLEYKISFNNSHTLRKI